MRRADVCSRRHRGNIRAESDDASRRSCTGAARSDEHDYRNGRIHFVLDDIAHGGIEAAGRIQFEHKCRRVARVGFRDPAGDVFGAGWTDRAGVRHDHNFRWCRRNGAENVRGEENRSDRSRAEQGGFHTSHAGIATPV
jgi:hypothetical protein